MEIGDVFCCSDHFGGSHSCCGLYCVVKVGKKFASLRKIACEAVEDPERNFHPSESGSCGRRKAIIPLKNDNSIRPTLVSHNNYDPEDDEAIVRMKGATCYKLYRRIKPDAQGNYVYTSTSQSYH